MHLLPGSTAGRTGFAESAPVVRVAAVLVGAVGGAAELGQVPEVGEPVGSGDGEAQQRGGVAGRHALGAGGARVQRARQAAQLLRGHGGGAGGRQPPPQRAPSEHHMPRRHEPRTRRGHSATSRPHVIARRVRASN